MIQNCWRAVDAQYWNVADIVARSLLPIKVANLLIMNNSEQITFQLSCLQVQNSLTLHWRSFWKWGCYCIAFSLAIKAANIVVMHNCEQIASQLTSIYNQKSLVLWAMDNVVLWHYSAFSWQFTACRSIHWLFINIAQLADFPISSSISSISMTYHKQFSKCWLCAPGLNAEWGSWMNGWMQQNGGHSYRFVLRIDRSIYDSYAITKWIFVSKIYLEFSLRVLTYLSEAWRNCVDQLPINSVWSLERSYGPYDPCTLTDELLCLTL